MSIPGDIRGKNDPANFDNTAERIISEQEKYDPKEKDHNVNPPQSPDKPIPASNLKSY